VNSAPATTDLEACEVGPDVSASGDWSECLRGGPGVSPGLGWRLGAVGLAAVLGTSCATAIPHYAVWEDRRDTCTVELSARACPGRPVTRAEALRAVRHAIDRAERERAELTVLEAQRGIRWERADDL